MSGLRFHDFPHRADKVRRQKAVLIGQRGGMAGVIDQRGLNDRRSLPGHAPDQQGIVRAGLPDCSRTDNANRSGSGKSRFCVSAAFPVCHSSVALSASAAHCRIAVAQRFAQTIQVGGDPFAVPAFRVAAPERRPGMRVRQMKEEAVHA